MTTPEKIPRRNIDRMLDLAGWSVQDMNGLAFTVSRGVAVREFSLRAGFADYMLFVDRKSGRRRSVSGPSATRSWLAGTRRT